MRKIILISILITFYGLMFNSCEKNCNTNQMGNVSFTATDLQITPYKGTEKLIFLDSLGDTLTFTGEGWTTSWKLSCGNVQQTGGPDCYGYCLNGEDNILNLNGNKLNSNMSFELVIDANPNSNYGKYFFVGITYKENPTVWSFYQSYNFNGMQLIGPAPYISNLPNTLTFKNSLIIGTKTFNSVYVLQQLINDNNGTSNLQYIFYTVAQGVVGFRTKQGGSTWYLNN